MHTRPHTLVLEASSAAGSVALLRHGAVVGERAIAMGASRADAMFPAIIELLRDEQIDAADVGAVVCGEGPGSFTSLRIAAAIAKGLAHANDIPLFAVSSLLLAAAAHNTPGDYVVHADALRGERYVMPVHCDARGAWRSLGPVVRMAPADIPALAAERLVLRVENAPRPADAIDDAALVVVPHARYLKRIADWSSTRPVDLASWESSYGRLAEAQVKWEAAHQQSLTDVVLPPGAAH